ncbi:MAG: hypothetical protein KJS95_11270 [Gammaproteobacteria bacterium]|nr:hypothetical protein [Gammaproteobacteria bacterium]
MSDDITQTLRAVVPKMPESGTPIAWPVKVRSELLLEAAAQIERLRAALEGIRIDGPDADGLVWATIQHPAIAVRSHVMVGNMERMVSQAFLEFEQMRRAALEAKP